MARVCDRNTADSLEKTRLESHLKLFLVYRHFNKQRKCLVEMSSKLTFKPLHGSKVWI